MNDIIELSEVNFDDGPLKSTNFGGGIELLMNDKIKEKSGSMSSDINLEDLNNLEDELNNLSNETSSFKPKSDIFSMPSSFSDTEKHSVRFNDNPSSDSSSSDTKTTWDGFQKFNNIPLNPDKQIPLESKMSKEELLREKFKFLRKLEALEKKGVDLSKKYNMESPLAEMQGEYETIMEEKTKQNSVKFQANMLMAAVNGIEFLNSKFDPFDIKLDGWSEQINENLSDYDEIFGELHEKYKSKASMAPELKLLFQLGGSAMMLHMTNTMFKSAMPGMDDILRQNPDLMRSFQNAAVNSMAQTSPGFSGFMSNMMNPEPQVPQGNGPPQPLATQGPNSIPPPSGRPGNNNYATRPDLNMGRNNFSSNQNDGINFQEKSKRPEMKGPGDISDILSGLKTKTINIQESQQQQQNQNQNDSSTISISDLKDLQNDSNLPKKSRRKPKSASNTVSLDI
jgi:hypothetical protein